MATPTRRTALIAIVALLVAGGGTFAVLRSAHGGSSAKAAAAVQQAAAPVLEELNGKVGPEGLRRIKSTIDAHAPSKAVERAARAVGAAGAAPAGQAWPKAAKGKARQAAKHGGWERRSFGRGAIVERR